MLYKPSNISPNFEEILCDDNGEIINGITFTFQVNTNGSQVRSYRLQIFDSYIDYQDEEESLVGEIYGVFNKVYYNNDIAHLNIDKNTLLDNNIELKVGRDYKWRIRLYEDTIPLYYNDVNFNNRIGLNSSGKILLDGVQISEEEAYDKYGLVLAHIKGENEQKRFFTFNNFMPDSYIHTYSEGDFFIYTVRTQYSLNLTDDDPDGEHYYKINSGSHSYLINKDFQDNLYYYFGESFYNKDLFVLYYAGPKFIKGQTLMGSGYLMGSTKDTIWLGRPRSQIEEEGFLELEFPADYFYKYNDAYNNQYVRQYNCNNNDFAPIKNINEAINTYSTVSKIKAKKCINPLNTNYLIGWNGGYIVKDVVEKYNEINNKTISFEEFVNKNIDINSFTEKWYIQNDIIDKNFIKYLTDGNTWIKIFLNTNSQSDRSHYLSEYSLSGTSYSSVSRYNVYKKITSSGYDENGFYIGFNANEGFLGSFLHNGNIFYTNTNNNGTYSDVTYTDIGDYYIGTGFYKSLGSPLFNTNYTNTINKTPYFTLKYKQREQIFSVEQMQGGNTYTKVTLYNEMNFSKYQYGERESTSTSYGSICCTNMASDNFTESLVYISPHDNSITSNKTYIYFYYFDSEKKNIQGEISEEELRSFAIKIASYDQNTGAAQLEIGLNSVLNTGWRYQIFNTKSSTIEDEEIINKYFLTPFSNRKDKYLGDPDEKKYEMIVTNYAEIDADDDLHAYELFVSPNTCLKEDPWKPTLMELYNDTGTLEIQLIYFDKDNGTHDKQWDKIIDKMDGSQWYLLMKYNFSDFYNLISLSNNYSGNISIKNSNGDIDFDTLGIISAHPLDQFSRAGTKFRIYSNFVDSDQEGYIYMRPNKEVELYCNGSAIDDDTNWSQQPLEMKAIIKDVDYGQNDRLTKNITKIKWYQYVVERIKQNEEPEVIYKTEELYNQNYSCELPILPNTNITNGEHYRISLLLEDEFNKQYLYEQNNITIETNFLNLNHEIACNKQAIKLWINGATLGTSLSIYKLTYDNKTYQKLAEIQSSQQINYIFDYNIGSNSHNRYIIKNNNNLYMTNNIDAQWNNWTIMDMEYDLKNKIYIANEMFIFKANIEYGSFNENLNISKYEPFGKFNKVGFQKQQYRSGNFQALLGEVEFVNGKITCVDNIYKYSKWVDFITNKKPKLLKDPKGNIIFVAISENPISQINQNVNGYPTTIQFSWQEIEDINKIPILGWDSGPNFDYEYEYFDQESTSDTTI